MSGQEPRHFTCLETPQTGLLIGLSVWLKPWVVGANTIPICSSTLVDLTVREYVSLGNITRKVPVFSVGMETSGLPLLENTTSLAGSWEAVLKSNWPDTMYFVAVTEGRFGELGDTSTVSWGNSRPGYLAVSLYEPVSRLSR